MPEGTQDSPRIEARDQRSKPWLWIHHDILSYLVVIGAKAFVVYCILAKYANNASQQSWPSQATLSKETGLSTQLLLKNLRILEKYRLIATTQNRENGRFTNNIYRLIDVVPHNKNTVSGFSTNGETTNGNPANGQSQQELDLRRELDLRKQLEEKDSLSPNGERLRRAGKTPPAPPTTPWPEQDAPFALWLQTQTILTAVTIPTQYDWWCALSWIVNGIPAQDWVAKQFAKMQLWFEENPRRRPTPRGTSRFIRAWLERSYEEERRYGTQRTTARA